MLVLVFFSVELWCELGCYEIYGEDFYKLKNCEKLDFILGLIYEEIFIVIVCDFVKFYK